MTTRLIADSEHMDHVTILLARVCAARLDTSVNAEEFVRMIARLVDVAISEAIADGDPAPKRLRCMYCMQTVEGPHDCERMRELGLVPPKANGTEALLRELGALDDTERSTGAAAIAQRAEQHPAKATATEPPAAPSIAEPASSQQPPSSLSESAADDAGTSPAGVSAGAGESQPRSPRARLTPQQVGDLRSAFRRAMLEHDDELPNRWIAKQAAAMKLPYQTVYTRITQFRLEHPAERAQRSNEQTPSQQSPKTEEVPDYVAGELPHTETPSCWCRKKSASREHVWCKLRRPEKPAREHAALRQPQRRVTHIQGSRY